jgi:hypothetical protein
VTKPSIELTTRAERLAYLAGMRDGADAAIRSMETWVHPPKRVVDWLIEMRKLREVATLDG